MGSPISWRLLPHDLIELQLGQIDLLLAMYPDDITLDQSSQTMVDMLRSLEDDGSAIGTLSELPTPPSIPMLLQVSISSEVAGEYTLGLGLVIPFTYEGEVQPEDPPKVKVRVQQPPWLNRAAVNQLMIDLPHDEDLLGTVEHIKEAASQRLKSSKIEQLSAPEKTASIVRVWFYFPSISTRSKRDDFIIHAPSYFLTGFLYAGKPGLLCVEGDSQSIDDYMKFIKTESWGDIPAHHKKVSERYRESKDVQRVFTDMTEITDLVGERRGQRANRGDMKAMEEWLIERGLGEAFTKVLM
ncbi:hypothetical protein CC86DRAFT_22715 [Ophiobolus disseminans]|uniref:Small nuclear ribonucleoprotein Prp3 C-terminal domain-containing protein n=1 Tax=Ophiobolus disseminans TaxID=1469910 RepID=A0A6A7A1G0_9PLEO|nr:hypothetical protein CC86DRAFT_22715 [Ophiobolus disseminans]